MSDDNRNWMYNRLQNGFITNEFFAGIESFVEFAKSHPNCLSDGEMRCPCNRNKCRNRQFLDENTVKMHLGRHGFVPGYFRWIHHGEQYIRPSLPYVNFSEVSSRKNRNLHNDLVFGNFNDNIPRTTISYEAGPSSFRNLNEDEFFPDNTIHDESVNNTINEESECQSPNDNAKNLFEKLKIAEAEIWQGNPVTEELRSWYWDQFVATYKWSPLYDSRVKMAWTKSIATQYRKTMHSWRQADRKPACLAANVWASWKDVWASEVWQERAEKYKGNRHSEPAGPGTGMTKHTAGSRSFVDHNKAMRAELGREPNSYELFYKTHTNKAGEFVDERSRSFDAAFQSRREIILSAAGSSESNISDREINQLYLDVVGGVQKGGKVYGLGTQASSLYPDAMSKSGASSSSRQSIVDLRQELKTAKEEVQTVKDENALLRDRMGSLEETVRALVASMNTRNTSPPVLTHRQPALTRHQSSRQAHHDGFTHVSGTYGDNTDDFFDFHDDDETQP